MVFSSRSTSPSKIGQAPRRRHSCHAVDLDALRVVAEAGFGYALLCRTVDLNQPEGLGEAHGPFPVVGRGPVENAAQLDTLIHGLVRRLKIGPQVGAAPGIMHYAIDGPRI